MPTQNMQEGYVGAKCDDCAVGHFHSINGCAPCNCSEHSSVCRQNENVTDIQAELCDCPPEYSGDSCEVPLIHHHDVSF